MNRSINSRYRLLITILLGLLLLESLLLLASIVRAKDLTLLASDLQTIIIVFVFIIFIYGIVIFNYIPFRLKKSVREVSDIIETQFGYHIIFKTDHEAAGEADFDQVREQVRDFLRHARRGEAMTAYVGELKAKAEIEAE